MNLQKAQAATAGKTITNKTATPYKTGKIINVAPARGGGQFVFKNDQDSFDILTTENFNVTVMYSNGDTEVFKGASISEGEE